MATTSVLKSSSALSSNSLAAQVAASQPGYGYGGTGVGLHSSSYNPLSSANTGIAVRPTSAPAAPQASAVAATGSSSARGGVSAASIAAAAPGASSGASRADKPVSPFMNAKGQPYVTSYSVDIGGHKSPADVVYSIRDKTTADGMQPQALKQLTGAAQAASQAGLSKITVIAARGQGHLSHMAGTEWDVVGYNPDGSMWSPEQRVAVAEGARGAGANRFGLYSFGPGYLGSGTLHFGYRHPGSPGNVTWGYQGYTSVGQALRAQGFKTLQQALKSKSYISPTGFVNPAEKAFSQAVASQGKFDSASFLKNKGNVAAAAAKAGLPADQAVQVAQKPVNALIAANKNAAPVLSYTEDPATGAMKEDPYKALLKTAGADKPTSVPVLKYGDRTPQVKAYQTMLASKGLYHGRIDGIFGPETDKATRVYQHAANLTVDGKIGLGDGAETGPALEHDFMLSRIRPPSPTEAGTQLAEHVGEIRDMTGGKSAAPGTQLFQAAQNAQNYQDPIKNRNYVPPAVAQASGAAPSAAPVSSGFGQASEAYGAQDFGQGYNDFKQTIKPDDWNYVVSRTEQMNKELGDTGRRPVTPDEVLNSVYMQHYAKPAPAAVASKKVKTQPVTEGYYVQPGEEEAVTAIRSHNQPPSATLDPFNTKSYNKDQSRMSQYSGDPPQVTNDAQYDALPSGTVFRDPEGNLRRKP